MTVTQPGFVQIHEQEALEGRLCTSIDEYLTRTYGALRPRIGPGLRWLTGCDWRMERWMDHPEYRIKDRKRTFISRPYQCSLESLERVVEIAKAKGVDLLITAPSNYNLDTILIILTEKGCA